MAIERINEGQLDGIAMAIIFAGKNFIDRMMTSIMRLIEKDFFHPLNLHNKKESSLSV